MHAQAKSTTAASDPDLEQFLTNLNPPSLQPDERINIEGVTGSRIEGGGQIAFAIEDGRLADAHGRLSGTYTLEWTDDLYHEVLSNAPDPNRPGTLLAVIKNARAAHPNRAIDSVLIGKLTGGRKQFYVQVTFMDSGWGDQPPAEQRDKPGHDHRQANDGDAHGNEG